MIYIVYVSKRTYVYKYVFVFVFKSTYMYTHICDFRFVFGAGEDLPEDQSGDPLFVSLQLLLFVSL